MRVNEHHFLKLFEHCSMFQTENDPFLPPPMNQSRTKGNDSEFFPFFPSTLGRENQAWSQKRRVVLLRKSTTLFGFDEKREREKQLYCVQRLEWRLSQRSVFTDNRHGRNSRSNQKPCARGCARPLGEGSSDIGWASKFFFFYSAELRQPYNA